MQQHTSFLCHPDYRPLIEAAVVQQLRSCFADCRARGPGFESGSRRYHFRNWVSPVIKSRYDWNIVKATYPTQPSSAKKKKYSTSEAPLICSILTKVNYSPPPKGSALPSPQATLPHSHTQGIPLTLSTWPSCFISKPIHGYKVRTKAGGVILDCNRNVECQLFWGEMWDFGYNGVTV